MEINVRPWLAVTLLMLIAAIALGTYGFMQAQQERRLIDSGVQVDARVMSLGNDTRQMPRDEPVRVTLEYADPASGRVISSERLIHRKPGGVIKVKEEIEVRIDSADPTVWTARTEALPLLQPLTVPLIMLPIVLLSLIATWWQRSRVMRVLATGTRKSATVASIRQSPLAPMSKQIGLSIEGTDRTVRQAYWPTRNGPISKGQMIQVIHAGGKIVLPEASYNVPQ